MPVSVAATAAQLGHALYLMRVHTTAKLLQKAAIDPLASALAATAAEALLPSLLLAASSHRHLTHLHYSW